MLNTLEACPLGKDDPLSTSTGRAPDTTMKGLGLATATLRTIVVAITKMIDAEATMPLFLCPIRNRNPQRITEAEKLPRRVNADRALPM